MDKIALTCGHYDVYRKSNLSWGKLELSIPRVNLKNKPKNECFNEDANDNLFLY